MKSNNIEVIVQRNKDRKTYTVWKNCIVIALEADLAFIIQLMEMLDKL